MEMSGLHLFKKSCEIAKGSRMEMPHNFFADGTHIILGKSELGTPLMRA